MVAEAGDQVEPPAMSPPWATGEPDAAGPNAPYAELERNSAAVAFYRAMGTWPVSSTSRTAWDSYSETLARDRQTAMFQRASQGYAALENFAYIAREKTLSTQDTARLVEENVGLLCEALHRVGTVAKIPGNQLRAAVDRLKVSSDPQSHEGRQQPRIPHPGLPLRVRAGMATFRFDSQPGHIQLLRIQLAAHMVCDSPVVTVWYIVGPLLRTRRNSNVLRFWKVNGLLPPKVHR
jgi:hypothetical protein